MVNVKITRYCVETFVDWTMHIGETVMEIAFTNLRHVMANVLLEASFVGIVLGVSPPMTDLIRNVLENVYLF